MNKVGINEGEFPFYDLKGNIKQRGGMCLLLYFTDRFD